MSEPSTVNPPLRRQAAWVVSWRVVGILATLGANILAARLGKAEFGIYLFVTTFMALGGLVGMAGLSEAGLRFISESLGLGRARLARGYLRRTLLTVAITSLVAASLTPLVMIAFQNMTGRFELPAGLLLLTALGILCLAWQQIAAESLRGFGNLRMASLFSGGQAGGPVSNLLMLTGMVLAASLSFRLDASVAIGLTVASIALTLPMALATMWRTSHAGALPADDDHHLTPIKKRELLAVGSVLLLNQLLAFASQQLDICLGGALLDPENLGLYGAAKRSVLLAGMPVQMAMMTVVASVPRLHAQQRLRELERVLRSAASYAAIPSVTALALLAFFPGPLLRLVFGGSYEGAAPTVLVLVVGYLVLVLTGSPAYVLNMTGRHRTVVAVNLGAAIVLAVVGFIGARMFGSVGLAVGSAASMAFQNGVLWWLAPRQLGVWTHVGQMLRPDAQPADHPAELAVGGGLNGRNANEDLSALSGSFDGLASDPLIPNS